MLFDPQLAVVSFFPTFSGQNLADFIAQIYEFSLWVVGLVVFMRFIQAGWLYFGAAGNASKTTNAKDIMTNAVIGAVLLFSAYLILYVINPDLTNSTVDLTGATNNSAGGSNGQPAAEAPVLKELDPANGQPGDSVTAVGQKIKGATEVFWDGKRVDSGEDNPGEFSFLVPDDAVVGDHTVYLESSGAQSNGLTFTVKPPPQ